MALTRTFDGVGLTSGVTIVEGSTAGTGDQSFTDASVSPSACTFTSGEIVIPDVAGIPFVRWNGLNQGAWSVRFYMRFTGAVDGTTSVLMAWSSTGVRMWYVAITSGLALQLRNSAGSTAVAIGPTLTAGTLYRVELWGTAGVDSVKYRVYAGDATTAFYTKDTAVGATGNLDDLQFGRQSLTGYGPMYLSKLAVTDVAASIGPPTAPPPPPPTGALSWSGAGLSSPTTIVANTTVGTDDEAFNSVGNAPVFTAGEIVIPNVAGITYVKWSSLALNAYGVRVYLRVTGTATSGSPVLFATRPDGTAIWRVTLSSSLQLQLRNGVANTVLGNGPVLTSGALYRVEVYATTGNATIHYKVYDDNEDEVYVTHVATDTSNVVLDGIQIGRFSSAQYGPAYLSHLAVEPVAAVVGPIGGTPPPGDGIVFHRWIGGQLHEKRLLGRWDVPTQAIIPVERATPGVGEPPPPPPPGDARDPFLDPWHSHSIWKTPVGSALTYLSTTSSQHLEMVEAGGQMNYRDWTDSFWKATTSDPLVTVERYEYLVTYLDWPTPTSLYSTSWGKGPHKYTYGLAGDPIRIPLAARWFGEKNQDRKVFVMQPNGEVIEIHKFARTTDPTRIFCSHLARNNPRLHGMLEGAIASGISPFGGVVRRHEMAAAKAGDVHSIKHALRAAMPNSKLKPGHLWPARSEDSNSDTTFQGETPYGTMIVLDRNINIETLTYNGAPLTNEAKAIAYALQDYGAYVLIRAGASVPAGGLQPPGAVTFYHEGSPLTDNDACTKANDALKAVLYSRLRITLNWGNVGALDPATRVPVDPDRIAGGGAGTTRRDDYTTDTWAY